MKKRMLSIILTVCMIMSAFAAMSVTVSAAESGKCGDNLTWTLDDEGTLTIIGIYGSIVIYHGIIFVTKYYP